MSLSTLAAPARFESLVKKSRFLAQAAAVDSAQGAMDFLAATRTADASHNCWAFRVGETYRFSDDGEPSGTAGRPILAAIDGQSCDRVAVVVARWFGGIKLGAGGLVRAYGGAASECLRQAQRIALVELTEATIACDFGHVGAVHQLIAQLGADKRGEAFGEDGLRIDVTVPRDRLPGLRIALRDATRGQGRIIEKATETESGTSG